MKLMIVKSMDINIQLDGRITSVIGPKNSGKTLFLKKLCNKLDNEDILLDDVSIKEYDVTFLKNNIAVCLDDNYFNCEYVAEELYYYLNKLGYRIDEITKKIANICKYFKIENRVDERIDLLPLSERMLVKILSLLIIEPKIFAVDNLLIYLDKKDQDNILKYLKLKKISFINVTTDSEFLLETDDVIVMNNLKSIYLGNAKNIIDGNSILPYMGIKLPFIVDLSQNLILYQLINKVYLDSRKLVDKLWK